MNAKPSPINRDASADAQLTRQAAANWRELYYAERDRRQRVETSYSDIALDRDNAWGLIHKLEGALLEISIAQGHPNESEWMRNRARQALPGGLR